MIVEDEAAVLRRRWRDAPPFSLFRPLYPWVAFIDGWLVLGDSTPLARILGGSLGEPELAFKGGEERVLALLALAYMRPTPTQTLDHMRRAARDWARGEKSLAYIHLAFGRLSRLEQPEEAAFRLFMADGLLTAGARPVDLLKAFGLDHEPIDLLEKYSPDQPRVPQGNGRESGQWTAGGVGSGEGGAAGSAPSGVAASAGAMIAGAESFFVEDLAPRALAGLAEMAAGASAPALTFGLLFIPSPGGSPVVDGPVPGQTNLLYHWDRPAGEVALSWSIAGSQVPFATAEIGAGGLYYDADGRAIARVLNGALVIDVAAATAHQSADDDAAPAVALSRADEANQPKLCPDPGLDAPHGASEEADAYETKITGLPPGVAVWLNGVPFDGCRESDGTMLEAKGYGYDNFIDENGKWEGWFANGKLKNLIMQLQNQSSAAAAAGRSVEWYVAEPRPAALIRKLADSFPNISVIWHP